MKNQLREEFQNQKFQVTTIGFPLISLYENTSIILYENTLYAKYLETFNAI